MNTQIKILAKTNELQCLQIFRGVAAIMVLLYHVGVISNLRTHVVFAADFFKNGFIGVDFFFVLSGFIIFYSHEKDLGAPLQARRYILKRITRIWPLLALLTTIKLTYIFLGSGYGVSENKQSLETIICSYLMLPISETFGSKPILDVAWTLSYEMLFYSVFAFGIIFGRLTLIAIGILWILIISICSLSPSSLSHLTYFLFNPHALQFMMGCGVAMVLSKTFSTSKSVIFFWCCLGLGFAGLLFGNFYDNRVLFNQQFSACVYWGTIFSLIIYGAIGLEKICKPIFPRILTLTGDASYSIYLFHTSIQVPTVLVASKMMSLTGFTGQLVLWLTAAVSLFAGICVYFLVERRIQKYSTYWIGRWS